MIVAFINIKCEKCGRVLDEAVLVEGHPATGDRVGVEAACPGCKERHDWWVKVFSGPAANMNSAWQRQCR